MAEFFLIFFIVCVVGTATKSGRNFAREGWKATGWRSPRAALQHHSGSLGAAAGRGAAGTARASRRGMGHAVAGFGRVRGRPLIPVMWRSAKHLPNDTGGTCQYCGAEDGEECAPGCPYLNMDRREMDRRKREGRLTRSGEDAPAESAPETAELPDDAALPRPVMPAVPVRERRICVACGNPEYGPRKGGGNWGPVVLYDEPLFDGDDRERFIHQAHFEDESTGFYGRPYRPARAESRGDRGNPHGLVCDCGARLPWPTGQEEVTCPWCGNAWEHDGADVGGAQLKVPDSPPPDDPATGTAPVPPAPTASAPTGTQYRRTNMTARYAINLEPPTTDGEFLESCTELGQVLKALAEDIGNWADGLGALNLPQSVTNPLHQIHEGIADAAGGATASAKAFEDEFEDARTVAARGMHFTGQDAA